ncbi:hypothetical protein [Aquibium sp. ELW1220]|uniref:hypothetical protein n=1 Tax=Aquibium sp. ELW1220 TaxID=2976766 RepID=UPI0025B06036|nr:hypothetical protein [Aquibium sp. ELW1220]MDN2578744.1 hypothetical protein [Aquibium sp. ELW1220]
MSALISKQLRVEVLTEPKKKNLRTVASVKTMYRKKLARAIEHGHLPPEAAARLQAKIDKKVEALVAL